MPEFAAILEALRNNQLTRVKLDNLNITVDDLQLLAESLQGNQSAKELSLFCCAIGNEGTHVLARVLKVNTLLTHLNLVGNGIGDAGALALANALKHNNHLTELNLMDNRVGNPGAQALATVLKVNKRLTRLNLLRNAIGDEGMARIVEAMQANTTLDSLLTDPTQYSAELAAETRKNRRINAPHDAVKRANRAGKKLGIHNAPSLLEIALGWIGKTLKEYDNEQERAEVIDALPKELQAKLQSRHDPLLSCFHKKEVVVESLKQQSLDELSLPEHTNQAVAESINQNLALGITQPLEAASCVPSELFQEPLNDKSKKRAAALISNHSPLFTSEKAAVADTADSSLREQHSLEEIRIVQMIERFLQEDAPVLIQKIDEIERLLHDAVHKISDSNIAMEQELNDIKASWQQANGMLQAMEERFNNYEEECKHEKAARML